MHNGISQQQQPRQTSSKKNSSDVSDKPAAEYEVEFPVGPMGLELEPVIISSERQLGCRVKDFYFGTDHSGVDPEMVMRCVGVGHVISRIDGVSVISLSFPEILNMLREAKDRPKKVLFKNISASCKCCRRDIFVFLISN